jgi:hypothetical protein
MASCRPAWRILRRSVDAARVKWMTVWVKVCKDAPDRLDSMAVLARDAG